MLWTMGFENLLRNMIETSLPKLATKHDLETYKLTQDSNQVYDRCHVAFRNITS
jgi:hypothetical protein